MTIAPGFTVEIVDTTPRRTRIVKLHAPEFSSVQSAIEQHGHIPLPPYIERSDTDADAARYQTIYAAQAGSVAAPTAGLHFTDDLLATLDARGVERVNVLLHVGAGTFRPVSDDDPSQHVMHEEWCEVTPDAAARLNAVRARGQDLGGGHDQRAHHRDGGHTGWGHPPLHRRNEHLPASTLPVSWRGSFDHELPLAALHADHARGGVRGYDLTMQAYRTAVAEQYRFYSYGDAMVLL